MKKPETNDRVALSLYLLSVVAAGFNTTGVILAGGSDAPLSAAAVCWMFTGAMGLATATVLWGRRAARHLGRIATSIAAPWQHGNWVAWLATSDIAFYLAASRYIDPGVALLIWEMQAPLGILVGYAIDRRQEIWQRDIPGITVALPLALTGLAAVAAAEAGGVTQLFTLPEGQIARTATGAGLALCGALVVALSAISAKGGRTAARALAQTALPQGMGPAKLAAAVLFTGHGIGRLGAGALMLTSGILSGEPTRILHPVHSGYAAVATSLGSTTWRVGMAISSRMEMHTLLMLAPALALAVQTLTGVSHPQKPEYLYLGATLLIAANLLLSLRAATRTKRGKPKARQATTPGTGRRKG